MSKAYTTYNTDDFLNDESFVEWARSGKNAEQWNSIIEGGLINLEALEEAKSLIQSLQFKTIKANNHTKEKLWNNIEGQLSTGAKTIPLNKAKSNTRRLWVSIAAAAAVALIAFLYYPKSMGTEFQTSIGEEKMLALEDGSSVKLNVNSELNVDYTEENRTLNLKGEAYFDVEKGRSFIVETEQGNIEVLGTTFNIRSRQDQLYVDCFTGSVKVSIADNKQVATLEAGESCALVNGILRQVRASELGELPEWQNGTISFENQTLEVVINEISNYHEIYVEFHPEILKLRRFTGKLETKDLKHCLESITWPLSLDYELEGKSLSIIEKEDIE